MRSSSVMSSNRPRSGVFYDDDVPNVDHELNGVSEMAPSPRLDDSYQEAIRESEARFRDVGWQALKETLETLADEVSWTLSSLTAGIKALCRVTCKCVRCWLSLYLMS